MSIKIKNLQNSVGVKLNSEAKKQGIEIPAATTNKKQALSSP